MDYQHQGITITFRAERGDFRATVDGKNLTTPSLDAMKKRIDALRTSKFQSFIALDLSYHNDSFEEGKGITTVRVKNIQKKRTSRFNKQEHKFECEVIGQTARWGSREFTQGYIHPDTPECRKAYDAYMKLKVANAKEQARMGDAERKLHAAIPVLKADEYLKGGSK